MNSFLGILLEILLLPFDTWRDSNENNRLGSSPFEKDAEHFWLRVGVLGFLGLLAVAGIVIFLAVQWSD